MTTMPLSLNGNTFNALKADFDSILRNTLSNMELKGADSAEMSIKLKISLERDQTEDFDASYVGAMRDIIKPKFDHTVQSVLQIKDKKDGTLSGNYELVWDPKEKKYEMREITSRQTSLFDNSQDKSEKPPALPGCVIDADYEELEEAGKKNDSEDGLEEKDDSSNTQEAPTTPFNHLLQFVGEKLEVRQTEHGFYIVCTKDGKAVLSSGIDEGSPFYCPEEKLEPHVGHEVTCVGYGRNQIVNISIECEDCQMVLFSLDDLDGFEEGENDYRYEEPDEEDDGEADE